MSPLRARADVVTLHAPVTDPSESVSSCTIGESSQSGMPRSLIASRSRAARDCPMAAIRSPNTLARTIRAINFSSMPLPAHDCLIR